jgi:hypothetical protein
MSLQYRHYSVAQVFQNTAYLPHTYLQTSMSLYRQCNKVTLREYYSTRNYVAIRLVDSLFLCFPSRFV